MYLDISLSDYIFNEIKYLQLLLKINIMINFNNENILIPNDVPT